MSAAGSFDISSQKFPSTSPSFAIAGAEGPDHRSARKELKVITEDDEDIGQRPNRICQVVLAEISKADFNPASRTSPKKLKGLIASIKAADYFVINAVHLTSDLHIIDGHRRVAACLSLGMTKIPALVYSFDSQSPHFAALYTRINSTAQPFGPKEKFEVAARGGKAFSASDAKIAEEMVRVLSPKMIETLDYRITAFKIAKSAQVKFLSERPFEMTIEQVLEYMFTHRMQQQVKNYVTAANKAQDKTQFTSRRLFLAIQHGLPLF